MLHLFLLTSFDTSRNMLRDLIPADLAKAQSTNEWKRLIVQHYNNDSGKRAVQHYMSLYKP